MFLSFVLYILGVIASYNRNRSRKSLILILTISFVYLSMTIVYFVADYFTNEGINEAVVYHVKYGLNGAGFQEYNFLVVMVIILFVISFIFSYFYYRILKNYQHPKPKYFKIVLTKVFLFTAIFTHPSVVALYKILNSDSASHTINNKMNYCASFDKHYIKPNIIGMNSKLYNLVYIYAESFERTYFDENLFPGLVTELKELENKSVSFTNIEQVYGTGWTIAGMVASQCGLPLVTPSGGNSMSGMNTFYSEATCIGDILKKKGYYLTMLQGSSVEFAGIKTFYKTHSFNEVIGKETLVPQLDDKTYLNPWGLYDDSLFEIAYKKYENLATTKKNFALYLATIDTHHPNGHETKECKKLQYKDGKNPILNAIHCSDKMIADFVKKIKKSSYGKNTVIVISSDHLAMKNSATNLLMQEPKRKDLVLVITPDSNVSKKIDKIGSTLDITPTLLNYLGFKIDSMGLGRNLLNTNSLADTLKDFSNCLHSWKTDISRFWNFGKLQGDIKINLLNKKVEINKKDYSFPLLLKIDDNMEITPYFEFDSSKKLFEHLSEFENNNFFIWIDQCEKVNVLSDSKFKSEYCYTMGHLGDTLQGFHLKEDVSLTFNGIKYLKNNIIQVNEKQYQDRKQKLKKLVDSFFERLYKIFYIKFTKTYVNIKGKIKSFYFLILEKWDEPSEEKEREIIKKNIFLYKTDKNLKNRFIAHAGGMIEGYKYTNSLEALNNSYKNGFKLFELDIIKTSDNEFVAAHDWNHWAKITSYKGTLPPALEEFKKYKLYDKFTPLDINNINEWFQSHPDAILVTDKVNNPKIFVNKFIDKKRLMMELFTWDAIKKVSKLDIKSVLLTESLLLSFQGDVIRELLKLKVDGVAASYKILYAHPNLVRRLLDNKINLYIFHVNYDTEKDEDYFICNKLNLIYGLYADKWNFDKSLNCKKYLKNGN